jgi:Tfp pilus assembly protein PilP
MKLTTSILAMAVMAGTVWAQNPDAIDNARSMAKSLQQKQANDSNAALDAAGVAAKPAASKASAKPAGQTAAKPTGQNPAPAIVPVKTVMPAKTAVKPAVVPAQAASSMAKPTAKAAAPGMKTPVIATARTAAPKGMKKVTIAAKPEVKPVVAAKSAAEASKAEAPKPAPAEEKKWAMSGKRDPFFSPVVQAAGGSGCSTGKKCLEIGHINVRGVVKSDTGFIAVVTNDLNKAYFLRENDPVFNGYVVRITGDSVVFQETVQDKLGKPFTREVTKRIFTPAV